MIKKLLLNKSHKKYLIKVREKWKKYWKSQGILWEEKSGNPAFSDSFLKVVMYSECLGDFKQPYIGSLWALSIFSCSYCWTAEWLIFPLWCLFACLLACRQKVYFNSDTRWHTMMISNIDNRELSIWLNDTTSIWYYFISYFVQVQHNAGRHSC